MPTADQDQIRGAGRPANYSSAQPRGKSCFLGVAVDEYEYFTPLRNAVRDMEAVRDLLLADYDLEAANCKTLCDREATRKNILRTIGHLDEWVGEDDKLIIYYSGHGHLNRRQRGFWIPVDAERGEEDEYVSNARLRELLADIPAKHILVISDSCFSGTLFVRAAQRADAANEELEIRSSRWALCSGRNDQVVADGKPGEHSPFAQSILQELRLNTQASLRIGSLADRVIELTRANYEQLPEGSPLQGVGHQGGQYVFRRRANTSDAWASIQALPDDTLAELRSKRSRLRAFLREHPDDGQAEEVIQLGIDLDDKREFLQCYHSEFRIRAFIRKDTAYREAARKRLAELEVLEEAKTAALDPPEAEPQARKEIIPKPEQKSKTKPTRKAKTPRKIPAKKAKPSSFAAAAKLDNPVLREMVENMVFVEGGTFTMGWVEGRDVGQIKDALPAREVTVPDFHLCKYPVTQLEWLTVMGENPSHNQASSFANWLGTRSKVHTHYYPVENVSWEDVQVFLEKLNARTGLNFRLPSEAEWEYAARGGSKSKAYLYSGSNELHKVAWYNDNAEGATHCVGLKRFNELGLYDMNGNVWEWCADDWHTNYQEAPLDGQAWIDKPRASARVMRGGSYNDVGLFQCACRFAWLSVDRDCSIGFRLACPSSER